MPTKTEQKTWLGNSKAITSTVLKPYSQQAKHPGVSGGRDKFRDPDSSYVPPVRQVWADALVAVDISPKCLVELNKTSVHFGHYALPDPALLIMPGDDKKKLVYLLMWLCACSALLYHFQKQDSTVLSNQAWHDFLEMCRSDKLMSDTAAAAHREEIRKIMGGVLGTAGVSEASPMWIWVQFIGEMKNCLSTSYPGFLCFGKFCGSCMSWTFASNSLVWINVQTWTLLKKIWQFMSNAFGHAFLHLLIFLLSWYHIWTSVLLPTIGESGSLLSQPSWMWCLAGRGQSQRSSSIGSIVLKNFQKVWHWNWNAKQVIFICKHFTTTLAMLLSSHIAFCLLYDLTHVFSCFFLIHLLTNANDLVSRKEK